MLSSQSAVHTFYAANWDTQTFERSRKNPYKAGPCESDEAAIMPHSERTRVNAYVARNG